MKLYFQILLILATLPVFCQDLESHQIPPKAKENLMKLFPGQRDVVWERDDLKYVADFFQKGKQVVASFDVIGNLLLLITEVDSGEVPEKARKHIRMEFKGAKPLAYRKIVDNTRRIRWSVVTKKDEWLFTEEGVYIPEVILD